MKAIKLNEHTKDIRYTKNKVGNVLIQHKEIKVWMEVWYDSLDGYVTEWKKYIFSTNCQKDKQIKDFQESSENFKKASKLAIEYYINN